MGEKLGKILTPVQKLKNAEKINGTPTDIEKIKLEKPMTPVKNEEDGEQARDQEVVETIKKHLFDSPCNPTVKTEEDIEKADEKTLENLINISVEQPKIKEEEENNLLDISGIENPPQAQPVEEFKSLEKLGKILTPVQKLKNAEKINGTPTDIEKIKLEKPTT